ncbi:MAG: prepilin-type N-terminal cleavage/methylation domain-containing protein [Nitrospirota bacterium]
MIKDKKGLTLIEVMVALVVLLIVFLGMMQAIAVAVNMNVKNQLRGEGVRVADERVNALKNLSFGNADLNDTGGVFINDNYIDPNTGINTNIITRSFRNFDMNFTSTKRITDINADNKRIELTVSWTWRNETFNHGVSLVLKRP